MNSKKGLLFICLPFLLVGIIITIAGVFVMKQSDSLKQRCTEKAIGTVVEIVCREDYDYNDDELDVYYYPVIEYQAGDITISQMSKSGQYPSKYKVGDQVEIYYNPNNAEEYIIKGDSTANFLGIGFIVFGSISVAVGLIVLVAMAIVIRNSASTPKVGKSERSNDSEFIRTHIDD